MFSVVFVILGRGLNEAQLGSDGGELNHGEVVAGELLVAGNDPPEGFDLVEEALDAVALFVKRLAEVPAVFSVRSDRNVESRALALDVLDDGVSVVGLVADDIRAMSHNTWMHRAVRPVRLRAPA